MKRIVIIVAVVLLVCAACAGGYYYYVNNFGKKIANPLPMPVSGKVTVENVAPFFYNGLPDEYAFVDVRTVEEYSKIHTDGTINIPVALFEEDGACEKVADMLPKDKKIIFSCPFGPRAEEMFFDLTDPVADGGCGMQPEGMYYLWANVKYKKNRLVIR